VIFLVNEIEKQTVLQQLITVKYAHSAEAVIERF